MNYSTTAIDIGMGCSDCTFENITATNCAMGFKEEIGTFPLQLYPCGNNVMRHVNITINNTFPYKKEGSEDYFAIKVSHKENSGIFRIYDSTFNVDRTEEKVGTKGKAYIEYPVCIIGNVIFTNCIFNFGKAFSLFGTKTYTNGDAVYYAKFYGCSIVVNGGLKHNGQFFNGLSSVEFKNSSLLYNIHDNQGLMDNVNGTAHAYNLATNITEGFTVDSSTITIKQGSTNAMSIPNNTVIKNSKIDYSGVTNVDTTPNGFGILIKNGCIISNNTILYNSEDKSKALFMLNEANNGTIESFIMVNNTITTNAGIVSRNNGIVLNGEFKNNAILYTNDTNNTSNTTPIVNFGNSSTVVIDGNIFKGPDSSEITVLRKISNLPTKNSRIFGKLSDSLASIPDASEVGFGYIYYDNANTRLLMSNGTDWMLLSNESVTLS